MMHTVLEKCLNELFSQFKFRIFYAFSCRFEFGKSRLSHVFGDFTPLSCCTVLEYSASVREPCEKDISGP